MAKSYPNNPVHTMENQYEADVSKDKQRILHAQRYVCNESLYHNEYLLRYLN